MSELFQKVTRPPRQYDEALIDEVFGEDIPVTKVGFFTRISRFIGRAFGTRKQATREPTLDAYSKFKHFYEDFDRNDPVYTIIRQAATLSDEALRVANQRLRTSGRLYDIEQQLIELNAFIQLSPDEIDNLKKLLDRFLALAKERSTLLEKLTDYDSSLVAMEPLEDDAWAVIPSIKDAEKHQRALRMDIGYITGEKEELNFEREDMQNSMEMIRRLTIGVISVFAFVGFLLGYLAVVERMDIMLPTSILVFLVMAFAAVINFHGYKVRREMTRNMKKQQRAIELLNKKSVVYAYYTNFLRYCYKKYNAGNSRILESNLNDLESYRFLANRIDTVRQLMYETETGIERFLREKKLGGVRSTVEGFAKTVNLDDKLRRSRELEGEEAVTKKTLEELDKRHESVWISLTALNATDQSGKVDEIVASYIEEAEQLFAKKDTEEKEEPRPIWKLFELMADGGGEDELSDMAQEVVKIINYGDDETEETLDEQVEDEF